MKIVQISLFLLLAISISYVHGEPSSSEQPLTTATAVTETPNLIGSLSTIIVDVITRMVQYIYEIFDLKMRTIRFIATLYTDENLQLFKKYMNIALRFGSWLYNLVPESTSEGGTRLLSLFLPEQNQPTEPTISETYKPSRSNEIDLDKDTQDQLFSLEKLINSRSGGQQYYKK